MAVMDEETGQLLNYRQLLHRAKFKKQWSISSANKFGRLANGVGNRIKNPTNTIKKTFPKIVGKTSHMDHSCAAYDRRRREKTGQDSQWAATA